MARTIDGASGTGETRKTEEFGLIGRAVGV
jgi:hypothetical protein